MVVHSSQGVHSSLFHAATSLSTISPLLKTFVSLPFFFIPPPTPRQSIHHPHPTYFPLSLDNQSTILIQHTTPYPSTINPPSSSNIPSPTPRQSIHHPHPTYHPLPLDNQSTILIQYTTPYPSTINPPSSSNMLPPTPRQSIRHPHLTYYPLPLDNQSTILIQHINFPKTITFKTSIFSNQLQPFEKFWWKKPNKYWG